MKKVLFERLIREIEEERDIREIYKRRADLRIYLDMISEEEFSTGHSIEDDMFDTVEKEGRLALQLDVYEEALDDAWERLGGYREWTEKNCLGKRQVRCQCAKATAHKVARWVIRRKKMKAEKAIEELKSRVALIEKDYKNEIPKYQEVLRTAIESLEKHIPKKPIFQHRESVVHYDYADGHGESKVERYADWTCPVCGWFVGEQYVPRKHNQQKSNFCSRCGQAIDWDMKSTE